MDPDDQRPREGEPHGGWGRPALALLALLAVVGVVAVGPLGLLRWAVFALTSDTEYAPGYSEAAFERITPGTTSAALLAALGPPLAESAANPGTVWLYAADPSEDFERSGEVRDTVSYTAFRFDADGLVVDVTGQVVLAKGHGSATIQADITSRSGRNLLGVDGAALDRLRARRATFADVEAAYGPPRSVHASRVVRWLDYSRSPTSTHYRIRRVGLDGTGRVVETRAELYWD